VDLDEYQHVESPEQDRVDGEEVAGHDRSGMRLQELRPTGVPGGEEPAAPGGGAEHLGCWSPKPGSPA